MPTLQQLTQAVVANPNDQLLLEQDEGTRAATVSTLLAGTQPLLTLAPGALLGRVSALTGGPEPVSVGGGLVVQTGTLGVDNTQFASLVSPAFTGTPTAPTPLPSDNSNALATTAFVQGHTPPLSVTGDVTGSGTSAVNLTLAPITAPGTFAKVTVNAKGQVTRGGTLASADVTNALGFTPYSATNPAGYISTAGISGLAPLANPAFSGAPTAPTPATSDNSAAIATTAFVCAQGFPTATGLAVHPAISSGIWDGNHDVSGAINAAIAAAAAAGGGDVYLPAGSFPIANTIVNTTSNVRLRGVGVPQMSHDVGVGSYDTSTVLTWTGAAGGTMLKVAPHANATTGHRMSNAGVTGIILDGKFLAGTCAYLASVAFSTFDIGYNEPRAIGVMFDTISLAEANDPQYNDIRIVGNCRGYAASTTLISAVGAGGSTTVNVASASGFIAGMAVVIGTAGNSYTLASVSGTVLTFATAVSHADGVVGAPVQGYFVTKGLVIDGTAVGGVWFGNTSLNTFRAVYIYHCFGDAITLNFSDHNFFEKTTLYRQPPGTGYGIIFNGSNGVTFQGATHATAATSNVFEYVQSTSPIVARGTTSFTTPSAANQIKLLDYTNGGTTPTVEAGASLLITNDSGVQYASLHQGSLHYDAVNFEIPDFAPFVAPTTSLTVVNNSGDHLRLATYDGAHIWRMSLDSSFNLQLSELEGTGVLSFDSTGGITAAGHAAVGGALTVAGTTTLTGNTAVAGNLAVAGAGTFAGGVMNAVLYEAGWEPPAFAPHATTTTSLTVVNNSGDHMRLATYDGAHSWGLTLDGSYNLQIANLAGGGHVVLGNGSAVAIAGALSVGGTLTAPTPAAGDNSTNAATTAWVLGKGYVTSSAAAAAAPVQSVAGRTGTITLAAADVSGAAPLASPTFTGTPSAPTPTAGDNSTKLATTAYVVGQGYVQQVATVAALRALAFGGLADGATMMLDAYATRGDGGAGLFTWNAGATGTDNSGTIVNPTGNSGTGRWLRQLPDGRVTPQMFGAKGDGATDDTAAFNAALAIGPMIVPSAKYVVSNVTVPNGAWMEGGGGLGYSGDIGTGTPGASQKAAVVSPVLLAKAGTTSCILNVNGCNDATIKGLFLDGVTTSCDGVCSGSTQLMMERVTVVRCVNGLGATSTTGYTGLTDLYTHVATLINCEFANNTNGIANLIDTNMTAGAVSANVTGINLGSGSNGNTFVGCRYEWNSQDGVQGYACQSNVFVGGLFDRNSYRGVNLGAGCADFTFTGVQFNRNGANNTYPNNSHIALNGSTSVFFNGCVSKTGKNDDGTGNLSPAYFINYINTNALVTISGCDVSGFVTAFAFGTNPTSYVQRDNDGAGDTLVNAARPYISNGVACQTPWAKGSANIAPGNSTSIAMGASPFTNNYSVISRELLITATNNNSPYQTVGARFNLTFYRDTAVHTPGSSAAFGEFGGTGIVTWGGSGKLQLSASSVASDGSSWTLNILNGGTGDGSNWSVFAELH